MSEGAFLAQCGELRELGLRFLGLQVLSGRVTYFFRDGGSEVIPLEQPVEEKAVLSIVSIFPLADFAERQMYRDFKIKSIGNANLLPQKRDTCETE